MLRFPIKSHNMQLGLTKNVWYTINGAVLILVFLLVRVLNMPMCIVVYAAQYHQWSIMDTLRHLRWTCYAGIVTDVLIQGYWFISLLTLARGVIRGGCRDK